MYDTRENEGECICDSCPYDEDDCGCDIAECEEEARLNALEDMYEAQKECRE
jgi:hypothetical protein